jgi:outer membrane cobalamin receptor
MARRLYLLVIVILGASPLISQGISDTVINIEAVEITAEKIFSREEAGMKCLHLDTAILEEKVNLSLSDLLSENTSVFIKNHGRGALATASFRGSAASHTQVFWNGISINSPMAGMVDFSLIPVYIIDDLVLKHGAASTAERAGGIGGSILIGNKSDWDRKKVIQYIQGIGSYSTFDECLQLGSGNRKIRSKTRIYHSFSQNDFTFTNRNIGNIDPVTGKVINPVDTNDHAAYKRYGLLQELYFRPGTDHIVSVRYWGQQADRSIPRPTSYEGPDQSNLNRQQDADHRVVGDWNYYGPIGKIMLRSGYARKHLNYEQRNQVPGLGQITSIYSVSLQQSLISTLSYKRELGHDLSLDGSADFNLYDVNSRDTVMGTGYERQRKEISLSTSIQKGISDRLNINLMIRQDWVDGRRAPLVPFLGMDFRMLRGADLVIKGNIARNYHQPSLNDLCWQPGGNPGLLPEEGFSMETGLVFQQLLAKHKLKGGVDIYRSKIRNWIIWLPSYRGYWEPRNISEVISSGAEIDIQLNGHLGNLGYRVAGIYAYTRSINHDDSLTWSDASYGKQLVYIPVHSGNLVVHLAWHNIHITYQYNAYSERFTTSSNDLTRRDRLYPYFMNDLTLGGKFRIKTTGLSLDFKVFNLFNESYQSVLNRPMPGRNFSMVINIQI